MNRADAVRLVEAWLEVGRPQADKHRQALGLVEVRHLPPGSNVQVTTSIDTLEELLDFLKGLERREHE